MLMISKKVSSNENLNTRLMLMNNQAKEVVEKSQSQDKSQGAATVTSQGTWKCKFENVGFCKDKDKCQHFHPSGTCQSHSKLGSCPSESICNKRHPNRICFQFESYGSCFRGDNCRFRHPLEYASFQSQHKRKNFLGASQRGRNYQPPQFNSHNYSRRSHNNKQFNHNQTTYNNHQSNNNHNNQQNIQKHSHQQGPLNPNSHIHDLRGSRW